MTHLAQAERDAEAARLRLEQSLDELRGRLTPGHMLDEALDYAREGSAGEFVRNFGGQVKRNPMPVALVGVGLAWLMTGRGGSSADMSDQEARYRSAGDGHNADTHDTLKDKASRATGMAGDAAGAAYDSAASAIDNATGMARDLKNSAGNLAGRTSDMGRHMSRRTASRMTRMFEEQPLVLGLIGLGIGAALGCLLPGTRTENRLAGEASDDFKEQAASEMNRQADKAMHVAERAYEGAMQEGQRAASEEGWMESSEIDGSGKTIDQEPAR